MEGIHCGPITRYQHMSGEIARFLHDATDKEVCDTKLSNTNNKFRH
jgi:hypothetical protein